jgi:hypothetical protein
MPKTKSAPKRTKKSTKRTTTTKRRQGKPELELLALPSLAQLIEWKTGLIQLPQIIPLPGTSKCVGLHVPHQEQTQWCWAAVSNGVSHFYAPGSAWTQCKIANAELGVSSCCTTGSSAACNKPWYLDKALTRVGNFDSIASGTLSFAIVLSCLKNNRPPCARQAWSGGGAHFMSIVCCYEGILGLLTGSGSTAKRLKISDPWYGDSIVDYSTFVSGYQGTGTWTHSYRTKP